MTQGKDAQDLCLSIFGLTGLQYLGESMIRRVSHTINMSDYSDSINSE